MTVPRRFNVYSILLAALILVCVPTGALGARYGTATMIVSFTVLGGGSSSSPVFNYFQAGVLVNFTLTGTPTLVSVDVGNSWWILFNPLLGSNSTERWYSSQALNGNASDGTIVFAFTHQYYLIMQADPIVGGTLTPGSGWVNANATVLLEATPSVDYVFSSWIGNGTGSYSGRDYPTSVIVNRPITETAYFKTVASLHGYVFGSSSGADN